ncbi:MAG: hypothetical protein KKG33_14580 [candidate division Zixibacteria bacterium]|nr:hypothetical protein [candidate division Zixibacteria bacterium]
MSTQDDILTLTDRLKSLRRYMLFCRSTFGAILILTSVMAAFAVASLLHAAFFLPVWVRVAYLIVTAAVLIALSYRYIISAFIFSPALETVSRQVERKYPHLENRLIASLQLERHLHENRESFSVDMIRALIAQTSKTVEGLNLKASFSNNPLKRLAKYSGTIAGVVILLAFLTPGLFWSSLHVFSHPLTEIDVPKTYDIYVQPGTVEVLKYDPLEITVIVKGEKLPKSAEMFWDNSDEGSNWRSDALEKSSVAAISTNLGSALGITSDSMTFTYVFKDIKHSFRYFVRAGREESDEHSVTVVDKPRITGLKLTYMYPKYTRLKTLVIDENDGNVQALKGTQIKVELRTNKPVETGSLVFSDGSAMELTCGDTLSAATITVAGNKSYHAEVTDRSGYANPDPIEYRITQLEDAYPELYMVSPAGNVDLDDLMAVSLIANLADDFGFTKLNLNYAMHLSQTEQWDAVEEIAIAHDKSDQQVDYFWDLANIGMVPGSWIEYYLEVFDNDYVSGPKSTKGPVMAVRLPTLDELFAEIETSREDQLEKYVESLQQQKKITDEFEKLAQELKMESELDWESKKDIESVANKQQKLLNDLDEMARQFDEANKKAQENQLLSLQMVQKLAELQKLFEEVATDEMKEAMKKLQEALAKMDKDEVEKALDQFDMSLEDIMKNIERAIAQLKQVQVDQMMQDMIRQAEEILKSQQNVNSLAEKSKSSDLPKAAPKEQNVRNSMEDLKKRADELESLMNEAQMSDNPDANKFCSATKQSGAEQPMEEMIANMNQSDKENSNESGEQAEAKLQDMLSQMQDSQAALSMSMGAEMAQKMRKALDDIFYLNDKQEELYNDVTAYSGPSAELREIAEDQQKLQNHAEWLEDYLFELSKQSVFMQKQIDKLMQFCMSQMSQSTKALTEMNGMSSINAQTEAMYSLNQASRMIIESLNSQKQCNSTCNKPNDNMFKKMGQMCNKQKRINQKSEGMCNNPNQSGQGKQAMERLAAEQEAIRKSMQQLQQEAGDKKQIQGRLENLADEMKEVVEALEEGGIGEKTLERQKKIYQRMLDFQLSMERQDYSEVRQAERTDQFLRKGPDQLDETAIVGSESYEKRMQEFLDEGYPPEYESIIKDYFKAIMEVNKQ